MVAKNNLAEDNSRPITGVSRTRKPIVVSDWEGPWVSADHGFDVAVSVVPRGVELFPAIGNYVVYLADVRGIKAFQPGETLSLVAPFLIASGADERILHEVAVQDARFIKGALEGIDTIQKQGSSFWVVSTSYHQYVWYTAPLAGIPIERTICTYFPIDDLKRHIRDVDKDMVKEMIDRIIETRKVELNRLKRNEDMPEVARKAATMLDEFFLDKLPNTSFGPTLETVRPIGGQRKLDALVEILRREDRSMREAVVIGDSITDRNMLRETRENKGLSISFNGNEHAVPNANVAVASEDCMVTPLLVQIFGRSNIGEVEHVATNWGRDTLRREVSAGNLDQWLFDRVFRQEEQPSVYWVTEGEIDDILIVSRRYRATVRGEAVGKLTCP